MRAVVAQAQARFGALNGVIHVAGLVQEAARPIPMLDRPTCRDQFAAKVDGLYVLDEVLQGEALDFCLLCSSLSAVLGGIGFAAYAAANLFMDAFAHAHNHHSAVTWTSVNWDAWDFGQEMAPTGFAMTPQQGQLAFALAVNSGVTQLVHSTGDLQARFRRWVQMETTSTKPLPSLAAHPRPTLATAYVPANSSYEKRIAAIWQDLLGIEQVGVYDNFFDLGGDSVLGLQVIARIQADLGVSLPTVALYEAPTVSALAEYLRPRAASRQERREIILAERRRKARQQLGRPGVAIISMAGRFPGARTVAQLWENLCNGVESLTLFTDEALHAAGVSPELIADPAYVKVRPIIEDIDLFDAAFFGYSPREAELLDPQYRLFLECAWEALERSGYNNPDVYAGEIGVFAGVGFGSYYFAHPHPPQLDRVRVPLALNQDAFATTLSYKLDLRGPSFTVQTFCSTSLVATHIACQSLLNGECDLALAGGVTIRVPQQQGHFYHKDGIESPDGHCRPFGDQAHGTVFGDGLGIVVLKRLEDALQDRDLIHAVIKGSAVNNDGALKVGYTAPSVIGQAKAVATALDNAAIHPETIGYVEAHGSATKLGDPIEVQALTRAFRRQTDRKGYCALGSLKGNVGHTDRAAGVVGLIKATLAVQHGRIPPTLHFERPNPEIDFENSPFFVNTQLLEWPLDDGVPRRAGVNSLGLGGTNAHVILEEPPQRSPSGPSRPWQLLLLSARTGPALDATAANLARHLRQNDGINLADVAYTLKVGRRSFPHRRLAVCQEIKDALQALEPQDPAQAQSHYQPDAERRVVFMFPGIGDHYGQMARELYEQEVVFRDAVEQCSRILQPYLGTELRALLYASQEPVTAPAGDDQLDLRAMMAGKDPFASAATRQLDETAIAHPVVFAVEYALARLLLAWGIRPAAMVGYSIGEYVAACLAGVLSLQDALKLVAKRAQMIQSLPAGGMLAVSLSEADVQPWLTETISLAAHNGQTTCVLSGPPAAIEQLQDDLAGRGVFCRRLATTHAFHSSMMRPLVEQVTALAKTIQLNPPQIPYLSNVTGTWITAEEALDPAYWAEHMCRPIRFFEALGELLQQDEYLLLEVGPGQTLGSFAKLHPACRRERVSLILPTMRTAYERRSDWEVLLETLGKLWMVGLKPDWTAFYQAETRHLLPLPTYPFERQRYWLETGPRPAEPAAGQALARELMADAPPRQELADWFYLPVWRQTAPHAPGSPDEKTSCWLVFAGEDGLGAQVATWLADHDQTVITVRAGETFKRLAERQFMLRPRQREDYVTLLKALRREGSEPGRVIHAWNVAAGTPHTALTANGDKLLEHTLDRGFYSLLGLALAIGEVGLVSCEILVVSSQVLAVTGHETLCPAKATILGPCRVIPVEYPNVTCRLVDVALEVPGSRHAQALLANLIGELTAKNGETVVALRKHQRWVESFEPIRLPPAGESGAPALRPGGVYLITGGLGGIGLAMAEHLARTVDAKLVLVGRSGLPPRAEWVGLVASLGEKKGLGRRIRQVQNLEASGAQVLVIAADVTDEAQMRAAVEQAVARFGAIHGVIHAAGVPGKGLIQLKTPEMAAQVLAPKVQGTLVLERVLRGVEPDFVALFSSLTSVTGGGPGQVDYCAANAFLNAYAQCHAGNNKLTVSIDWGEWQWNAWEEGLADLSEEIRTLFQEHRERYGITFQEGAEALERILQRGLPQVLVSTHGLPARIKRDQTFGVSRFFEALRESTFSRPAHPRPALEHSYVPPKTKTEQTLASIWQESLGFERIGSHDDFFELGGNSLLAARITSRIREAFQVDVSMASLLNKPTLADLSEHIESIRWAAQEPQALDFATASDRERGEI
jgi:acyl transferase domain-containing protein/acyl carrier protein